MHPVVQGNMMYEPGSRLISSSTYLSIVKSFRSTRSTLLSFVLHKIAIPISRYGRLA